MENRDKIKNKSAIINNNNIGEGITVVPKASWIVLVGGVLLIFGIIFWVLGGVEVTTTAISGIYHPGGSDYGELICFPSISVGKGISAGMQASIYPTTVSQDDYGNMTGKVTYTDEYVTTYEEIYELLGDESLSRAFYANAPVVCVICRIDGNPDSVNGFKWTTKTGESLEIKDGTVMNAYITLEKTRASSFLLK